MLLAEKWLDLEDVEPEDLVFQIVRQLAADLKNVGFELGAHRFANWFDRLRALLSRQIQLDEIQVGTDPLIFTFTANNLLGARQEFRRILRGQLPTLYDLVNNELLTSARLWLANPDHGCYDDILIIVDQTDRIPESTLNYHTNHEQIFIRRAGTLRALNCDVLYTLPIELAYSLEGQGKIPDIFGTPIRKLPVIPIVDRQGHRRDAAHDTLVRIAERRVNAVGLRLGEVFTSTNLLDETVQASGGHVRNLFVFLRTMLHWVEDLPIDRDVVKRSLRRAAADSALALDSRYWTVLDNVHQTKQPANMQDATWYRLLRDLYILVYQESGGYWYDRNPILKYLDAWARP
jgi:hypothetical protein